MNEHEAKRDLEVSAKYLADAIDRITTIMAAGEFAPVRKVATAILEFSLWLDTLPVPLATAHVEPLVEEHEKREKHPHKHKGGTKHDDA